MLAHTPPPPYYAVIFSNIKKDTLDGYAEMADKMEALAKEQTGYLGMESSSTAVDITISYWKDEVSILKWKENAEHLIAQQYGRDKWYASFITRVCKVERDYAFNL